MKKLKFKRISKNIIEAKISNFESYIIEIRQTHCMISPLFYGFFQRHSFGRYCIDCSDGLNKLKYRIKKHYETTTNRNQT